jgi:PHD and RING finger domain-containing protein 1
MKSPILTLKNDDEISNDKESCPICLANFNKQNIGIPNSCKHIFGVDCINEWSKTVNTCPIDRKEFNQIQAKKSNGKFIENVS